MKFIIKLVLFIFFAIVLLTYALQPQILEHAIDYFMENYADDSYASRDYDREEYDDGEYAYDDYDTDYDMDVSR